MPAFRLAALAGIALALAGCDFTPTLDIPTPAFDDGMTLNAVLFADSTVLLRVTRARDPYSVQPQTSDSFEAVATATVVLSRDGGAPEPLRFVSRQCQTGYRPGGRTPTFAECGFYVSAIPIAGGASYTVRASAPGLLPAEARVRVPARVAVAATIEPGAPRETLRSDRVTLRFRDAPGEGQWYGLDVVRAYDYLSTRNICTQTGCRDTTVTERVNGQDSFTTADPILLAGLRGIPGRTTFVTFSDRLFDGQERGFAIETTRYAGNVNQETARSVVRLIAFDRPIVAAYEQAYFSLGTDNPFQQPLDPVSNVTGGYGLVGAAAITEIPLP